MNTDTTIADFWFATFALSDEAKTSAVLLHGAVFSGDEPLADFGGMAIELFKWYPSPTADHTCWAALVSKVDREDNPTRLECVFGVSNDPDWCNNVAALGFPVIEGQIAQLDDIAYIRTLFYPPRLGADPCSLQPGPLGKIGPLRVSTKGTSEPQFGPIYYQMQASPDIAQPAAVLVGRPVERDPKRTDIYKLQDSIELQFERALYPDLFNLPKTPKPSFLWRGKAQNFRLADTTRPVASPAIRLSSPAIGARLRRSSARGVFGRPAFLFDDLEIVGFRIDTGPDGLKHLESLVADLNFHLRPATGETPIINDFMYRPATATVVVEMIRYGSMRSVQPLAPFEAIDFMSQHELLVRILVGRVDDDTSQARDGAIFVPAIFVDNPWSKAVGRGLQGFPKELASFYAGDVAVPMDGKASDGRIVPMGEISEIRLLNRFGDDKHSQKILSVQCPPTMGEADFASLDIDSVLGSSVFASAPWQQADFTNFPEFRRSFARELFDSRFRQFRSVQVTPVEPIDLPNAWISGNFSLRNAKVGFPPGIASLTFHEHERLPPAWNRVCRALDEAGGSSVALPTGNWYRLTCGMDLQIDDQLSWQA